MKKITFILLSLLLLAGCQKISIQKEVMDTSSLHEPDEYSNNELGIRFTINHFSDSPDTIKTVGNVIHFNDPIVGANQYISVFIKEEDQTIEEAILEIIKNAGKSTENCKVINKGEFWANPKYNVFVLDLTNPKISYLEDELEEIKIADKESAENGGPFNGEWKKREIYNRRLVEKCSEYAEPLGLGTSKSSSSAFIYNNDKRFVFLPGSADPTFYEKESLGLFN